MYVVRNTSNNEIVALCSRPEDAQAYVKTQIDETTYVVEKQGMMDQANSIRQNEGIKKSSN